MKKAILAAMLATIVIPAAPALADPPSWAPAHGRRSHEAEGRHYERKNARVYDRQGRYYQPRRLTRNDRVWRGTNNQYYCKRSNGTTGLIIGAGVGALLGRTIDTSGDRALGTILGAAGGGLLGRSIDRGDLRCR